MKKSSLFAALALAACAALASAAEPQLKQSHVIQASPQRQADEMTAYRFVEFGAIAVKRTRSVLEIAEQEAVLARPLVELQRAGQYALRQIDRQRPEVTPSWREAPSV